MNKQNNFKTLLLFKKNRDSGFTLVELMIVIAIIGILNAIAIPNFLEYRKKAIDAETKISAKMFYISALAYFSNTDAESATNPPDYQENPDIEHEGQITLNKGNGTTSGSVLFKHKDSDKVFKLDGKDGYIYVGY